MAELAGNAAAGSPRTISHYTILGLLGQGGMGDVYVAVDTTLQRRVALKAVRRERQLDEAARARLLREARVLSQLDHPNICRVHDYITDAGDDFVVLELLEGRTLRDALAHGLEQGRRLDIAAQVASALVAAHAAGVVHRDLKPSNVMLLPDGGVKVLDFGLARPYSPAGPAGAAMPPEASFAAADAETVAASVDESRNATAAPVSNNVSGSTVTLPGSVLGTPTYMSPEQARGEAVGPPSDMFAFGLLLRALYARTPAYEQGLDAASLLRRVRRAEVAPPAGVRRDIAGLITRLLSLAPTRRPTAIDAVEQLEAIRLKPRRRLQVAAAAMLAAVLAGGGIRYTIDVTRERTAAVEARSEADSRRGQAEALIGFMLGDLRTRLEQLGRLDVLDAVGNRAMEYFAAVPETSLSDQELFDQSQAVHQIGQVRLAQGNLESAERAFGESLTMVAALAARDPLNDEWQLGLGASHYYVGEAMRLQGNYAGAAEHFVAYRDLAEALVARDPANPTYLLELSYGHSNVASVLESTGDLDGARSALEASLALKERLLATDAASQEYQEAVAVAHDRLGVVLDKLGYVGEALDHFSTELVLRVALQDARPGDPARARRVATAASQVGGIHLSLGDYAAAAGPFSRGLSVMEQVAAGDPSNATWQRDLGVAHLWNAVVRRGLGDAREARRLLDRAVALLAPLVNGDPARVLWQRDLAMVEIERAKVDVGRDPETALAMARSASERISHLPSDMLADLPSIRVRADAFLVAGDAYATLGEPDRAADEWARAFDVLEPVASDAAPLELETTWAEALLRTHRAEQADDVLASLVEKGVRAESVAALRARAAVSGSS